MYTVNASEHPSIWNEVVDGMIKPVDVSSEETVCRSNTFK